MMTVDTRRGPWTGAVGRAVVGATVAWACESPGAGGGDAGAVSEDPAAFEASALTEAQAELDLLVGRFARGDLPVWTGTGRAADLTETDWGFGGNGGVLTEREAFAEGPVVAWLNPAVPATLTVLHPGEGERMELIATPDAGRTSIGLVLGAGVSGGHRFECPSCPGDLLALGPTFTLEASGERTGTTEAPWRAQLTASLTQRAPEAVDWDLIRDLAAGAYNGLATVDAYVLTGDRRVFRKSWRHVRTVPSGPRTSCYEAGMVEADLWVSRDAPLETGVTLRSVGEVALECFRYGDES